MADEIIRETPGRAEGAAANRTTTVTVSRPPFIRRVSWGAIFAGAIVTLACQLLLSTLGLAIGMATVNPQTQAHPAAGLATGAGIWWLVTGLISLFAGGFVAGRMAGFSRSLDGILHGLTVWGLTAVAGLMVLSTSLATLLGGAVGGLQQVASAAASNPNVTSQFNQTNSQGGGTYGQESAGAGSASSAGRSSAGGQAMSQRAQSAWDQIKQEASAAIQKAKNSAGAGGSDQSASASGSKQSGETAPSTAQKDQSTASTGDADIDRVLTQLLKTPGGPTQADREAATDLLVHQAGMTREQAQQTVQRWESSYASASSGAAGGNNRILASPEPGAGSGDASARRTGQQAADAVTNAAIWAFVALILGAIAGALGGLVGKPGRTLLAQERVAVLPA